MSTPRSDGSASVIPPGTRTYEFTQVECKRHPGRSISHAHNACRTCGVYHGVAENFQVVTYVATPTEARQCTEADL